MDYAEMCVCGCEYEAHLTNINTNPEGEPSYEELGCRECDCPGYRKEYRHNEGAPVVLFRLINGL
jgi:hypothetical protein